MVTSCLSLCDLSYCFPFADLSLSLPARLGREILHLLVWFISGLCLAERRQVKFLATVVLPRMGKSPSNPRCWNTHGMMPLTNHSAHQTLFIIPGQGTWQRCQYSNQATLSHVLVGVQKLCPWIMPRASTLFWCLRPMYWILLTKHRMPCMAGSGV